MSIPKSSILALLALPWLGCMAYGTTAAIALTPHEQNEVIERVISAYGNNNSPAIADVTSKLVESHMVQARALLAEIDDLPGSFGHWQKTGSLDDFPSLGTGDRFANPLFREMMYHLISAKNAGIKNADVINDLYKDYAPSAIIEFRKIRLAGNLKEVDGLGLNTRDNLDLLAQGRAPIQTKGNPRFIGERVEVDHMAPISKAPQFENELANFQFLPASRNRDKRATIGALEEEHIARLNDAYKRSIVIGDGAVNAAFGAVMLYYELPLAYLGFEQILSGENRSSKNIWDTAGHAALAASGGSLLSSSAARFLKYQGVSEWAGRTGLGLFVFAEGVSIYEWHAGYMKNREFYTSQASIGGGLGGVLVGQELGEWIGGGLGASIGPEGIPVGAVVGKIGGGVVGGIYGSKGAAYAVSSVYERLDKPQQEEETAFVYQQYGVPYP